MADVERKRSHEVVGNLTNPASIVDTLARESIAELQNIVTELSEGINAHGDPSDLGEQLNIQGGLDALTSATQALRDASDATNADIAIIKNTIKQLPLIPFHNLTGEALPMGSIVSLWDGIEDNGVAYKGSLPDYPGISMFLITAASVPIGAYGWGYGRGLKRRVRVTGYASLELGQRVGTIVAKTYAGTDKDLGPMTVTGLLGNFYGDDNYYVEVDFHGRRGDLKAVIDSDGDAVGAFYMVVFDTGLTVEDGDAFVPEISVSP